MPQRPLGLQDNPIHLSPSSALSALRPCGQRGSGELGVRAVNGLLEINSSYVRPRHRSLPKIPCSPSRKPYLQNESKTQRLAAVPESDERTSPMCAASETL